MKTFAPEGITAALKVLLLAGADTKKRKRDCQLPAYSLINGLFDDNDAFARFVGRLFVTLIDAGCDFYGLFSILRADGEEIRNDVLCQLQQLFPEVSVNDLLFSTKTRKRYSFVETEKLL